jgi:hypothetical protein
MWLLIMIVVLFVVIDVVMLISFVGGSSDW